MRRIKELSFGMVAAAALLGPTSAVGQTLRGSRASVELMYERAQERSLDFMATPNEVYRALAAGTLQTLSFTDDLALDKAAEWRGARHLAEEPGAVAERSAVALSGEEVLMDERPRARVG